MFARPMQSRVHLLILAGFLFSVCRTGNGMETETRAANGRESADAHPISVITTDCYVSRNKLSMRLGMFAEDLYLFHAIEPDQFDRLSPDDLRWALEEHKEFLKERIVVLNIDGDRIPGKIVGMEAFEIPLEGIEVGRLMEHPMTYQMEFSFPEPPEFLTFSQEIIDENFVFPSEMQLNIKQSGIEEVLTYVLRPNDPLTRRFDWSVESLSEEDDQQAWEDWYSRQREETLGITSYGSVYTFFYVNPLEVRLEVLIPLGTLSTLFEVPGSDDQILQIDEQDMLKPLIEEFLKDKNPVKIDGIQVAGVFDRIDFYALSLRDFAMQAERKQVSMANGRVGVIISYPVKSVPDEVSLTWDLFGPNIVSVDTVVFSDAETDRARFNRFKDEIDNTYTWRPENVEPLPSLDAIDSVLPTTPQLSIPLVSMVSLGLCASCGLGIILIRRLIGLQLMGCGLSLIAASITWHAEPVVVDSPLEAPHELDEDLRIDLFERLHSNTYRAFDYREEGEIYDALANSVSGELLREIYLSVRSSMVMQSQGGAVARIQEVKIDNAEPSERDENSPTWPGYQLTSTWSVRGTVEHWGHIHERTNTYSGRFTIEPIDGTWKITRIVINDEQVSNRTGLRRF